MTEWNTELRSLQYPPPTISGALNFSLSDTVEEAYRMTEDIFRDDNTKTTFVLPPWAMTWPGGQLSGIGRNGCYAANIRRYERVFSQVFSQPESNGDGDQEALSEKDSSKQQFVNIVPLHFVGDESKLKVTLTSLMKQLDERQGNESPSLEESVSYFENSHRVHRNASVSPTQSSFPEPTQAELEKLETFFSKDAFDLVTMFGMHIDWMARDPEGPQT